MFVLKLSGIQKLLILNKCLKLSDDFYIKTLPKKLHYYYIKKLQKDFTSINFIHLLGFDCYIYCPQTSRQCNH